MTTHPFRWLFVCDVEATCDQPESFPRHETEIIEIGGVLVHPESLEPVDRFETFVRPVRHPRLTAFCTELTTIRQDQVDDAPTFADAVQALGRWLDGRPARLASWGGYDDRQFRREARANGVRLPWSGPHLNVKEAFAARVGGRMGLGGAVRRAGLRFEGTPHRGIDDAHNIVRLLPFALGRSPLPPDPRPH